MTPFQKRSVAIGTLTGLACAITVGFAFSQDKAAEIGSVIPATTRPMNTPSRGNTPLPVNTLVIGSIPAPIQKNAYRGLLLPSKEANLGFRRGGRISHLHVTEGSQVTPGQLLAELDSADVQSQLRTVRAQMLEAEAILAELMAGPRKQTLDAARSDVARLEAIHALAEITAERQASLIRSNASSVQQFDEARYAVQQSEAQLEAAKQRLSELEEGTRKEQIDAQKARIAALQAQVAALEVDLSDTRILAPFGGLIAERLHDEGTIATPQASVLRLIQCEPMEARFGVAPEDAKRLQPGEPVTIALDGTTKSGLVDRLGPELDAATRTQTVFVRLSDACGGEFIAGRTVSLWLSRRADESFWIPTSALLRSSRGLWSVYVVQDTEAGRGVVERRDIQVLETETELVRVTKTTLRPGERIVADGLHRITAGMTVSVESSR